MSIASDIRERYNEIQPELKYYNLIMKELFKVSSNASGIKRAIGDVPRLYRCGGEHLIKNCKVEFVGNNHKHRYCSVCSQEENQIIIKKYLSQRRVKKSKPKLRHCRYFSPHTHRIEDINEFDVVPKNKSYVDWHYIWSGSNGF